MSEYENINLNAPYDVMILFSSHGYTNKVLMCACFSRENRDLF